MRRLLWVLLALGLAACASRSVVRQGWDPGGGVDALLAEAAGDLDRLQDLTAEARVTMAGQEGKGAATAFIIYKPPSRFRVDIRGPLFTHVLTAVLDGDSLLVHAQGQVWRGTTGDGLLGHLLDVDLGSYHLPYAILGVVQPGRIDPRVATRYTRADRAIATLDDPGLRRRIWVDLFRGFVSREEVYETEQLAWSRLLSRYRAVGPSGQGIYLPREVEIRQGRRTVTLSFRRYSVNTGIDDTSIRRGIPTSGT